VIPQETGMDETSAGGGFRKNMKRIYFQQVFIVATLTVLLCWSIPSWSQSPARLDGTVQDQAHAAIPRAKVKIVNSATGVATEVTSSATGEYVFPFVLPGAYTLTATKADFKGWSTKVVFHANDHVEVNVTLAVAGTTLSVEVTSSTGQMQTDSGQRSETLTNSQIQDLATLGTDAEELLTLLPGVTSGGSSAYGQNFTQGEVSSSQGIEGFNINGNRSDANTFKLDGGNMDDLTGNNGSNIAPNTEFISEISVETSNFTADQGGSPILITAITKSGTKDLHGEGYWSGRSYIFDANDWSNNSSGTPRPQSKYNYPGFQVGGPILLPWVKYNHGDTKKLFFWFGAQWNNQTPDNGTELANVPTAGMLTGDFSDVVLSNACVAARAAGNAASTTWFNQPCQITDPATGMTLDQQGGKLSSYTSNGLGLLKSLLGPKLAGSNYTDPNGLWNYAAHPIVPDNVTQQVGRFDWNPSDKARIFVRLGRQSEPLISPWGEYVTENSTWTSNVPEPTATNTQYTSRSLNVNMVSILNPTLTNEFTFNTNALDVVSAYQDSSQLSKSTLDVDFNGVFGANSYPVVPQIVPAFGICDSFNESGCSGGAPGEGRWGASNLVGSGNFYKQTQFEFGDNLTWVKGAHILKFGGVVERARNDQNESDDPLEGYVFASPTWTSQTSGDEYADILTEHFSEFVQANHDVRGNMRSSQFEWYAQDSWKVRKNLTVEYGVRWTFQGPWYEARGLGTTFDPSAYTSADSSSSYDGVRTASCNNAGQSAVPLCGTIPKTIRPYGHPVTEPRIGISWDPYSNGKTFLRGGFGVYTQRDPTNAGFEAILGPPNLYEATIEESGSSALSLTSIQASSPGVQGGYTYGDSSAVYSTTDKSNPEIYQYNLTLSQLLAHHYSFELAYVGSQSRHLQIEQNIDNVPYGALWEAGGHLVDPAVTGNEVNYAPYNPFSQIVQNQHSGNANYNGLQATFKRQAGRDLDFAASYTYSKAMGDSDEFQAPLADPFTTRGSRHVLSFDHTHVFAIGYQYRVPSLPPASTLGKSLIARGALNHWMLSGTTKASSGQPIAISASVTCQQLDASGNATTCSSTSPLWSASDTWFGTNAWSKTYLPGTETTPPNGIYPTYSCDPRQRHGGINTAFINTGCVTLPAFGTQGAIDPPYMKSPGTVNFDLAMQKSFRITEARHLDIRVGAFDLTNRGHANALNTVADFNWVLPYGATDPDQGSAVLTNGTGNCSSGTTPLGYSCGKTGHRQMEGSAKFFF
jgi:hypothetical protein